MRNVFRAQFIQAFLIFLVTALASGAFALTGPASFTLDGRLYNSATLDTPLIDPSVTLLIQITNDDGTCILYEERQVVDTSASDGYFNIQVGTEIGSPKRSHSGTNDSGNSMTDVFQNTRAVPAKGMTCAATYGPLAGKKRLLRITMSPSTTMTTELLTPDLALDSVPTALVAETLQGHNADHFLQLGTTSDLTQLKVEGVFSGTNYTNLMALLGGSSSQYIQSSSSGALIPSRATAPSSPAAGQVWFNSATGLLQFAGSGGVINTIQATGTGGITSGQIADGAITGPKLAPNLTITTTGGITASTLASSALETRSIKLFEVGTGANSITMTAPSPLTSYALTFPNAQGGAGTVLTNNGAGILSWTAASGGASQWVTAGSDIYYSTGRVGVGTNAPTAPLQVGPSSTSLPVYNFGATIGATATGARANSLALVNAANQTNGNETALSFSLANSYAPTATIRSVLMNTSGAITDLAFDVGNSAGERMRITNAGNIGIGTSSPAAILDVYGTSASNSAIIVPRADLASRPSSPVNGMIRYNTSSNKLEAYANSVWADLAMGGSGGGTSQWSTNGSDLYYSSGKVGIGTASPSSNLHVFGSGAPNIQLSSPTVTFWDLAGATATGHYSNLAAAGDSVLRSVSPSNTIISNQGGGRLTFSTGMVGADIARLSILSGGNVGIGTSAPAAVLDVYGTTTANSALIVPRADLASRPSLPVNGMIRYNTSSNKLEAYANSVWADLAMAGSGGGSSQWITSGSDIYFSGGLVGIGTSSVSGGNSFAVNRTTNPSLGVTADGVRFWDLAGATSAGAYSAVAAVGDSVLRSANGNMIISNVASGPITFATGPVNGDTAKMTILNNGRVGVGTTAPTALLEVYSTGNSLARIQTPSSTGQAQLTFTSNELGGANAAELRIGASGSTNTFINTYSDKYIDIMTGNVVQMKIAKNSAGGGVAIGSYATGNAIPAKGLVVSGNVGVGTDSPAAILDVVGITTANSAIIVPRADLASRPSSPVNGMIRYNTSSNKLEAYANSAWADLAMAGSGGTAGQWSTSGSDLYYNLGRIGVGTATPAYDIHLQKADSSPLVVIENTASTTANYPGLSVVNYDGSHSGGFPVIGLRNSRGNAGAKSASQNGDTLGFVGAYGMGSSAWSTLPSAGFQFVAAGAFSNTSYPTDMILLTTPTNGAAGVERMRVTSAGLVGIGTNAPEDSLEIYSTGGVASASINSNKTNGTAALYISNFGSGGNPLIQFNSFGGSKASPAASVIGANLGNIQTQGYGATTSKGGTLIASYAEATFTDSSAPSMMQLSTTAPSSTTPTARLTISGDGAVAFGPNRATTGTIADFVGSGTSFSSILLPRDSTANRPTGVNGMVRFNTNTQAMEVFGSGAWTSLGAGGSGSGTSQWTTSGSDIYYSTGKVGIGTNNPATALDIVGAFSISGANAISFPADTTAGGSIAIGSGALSKQPTLTAGNYANTAVGYQALPSAGLTAAAIQNTAVGYGALYGNTSGSGNTVLGYMAGSGITTGGNSVIIGRNANVGYSSVSSAVSIGPSTTAGAGGVSIGENASSSTNGSVTIGSLSGTGGNGAIAIGYLAKASNGYTIAIGNGAGQNGNTGTNNIFIGPSAGSRASTGSNNLVLGTSVASGTLASGSNNILLGTNANVDTPAAATSNFLNLGNAIFGTNINGTLASPTGNIGIGTASPAAALDIYGTTTANSAIILPRATTANRPSSPVNGMLRYNTDLAAMEIYGSGAWTSVGAGGSGSSLWTAGSSSSINYTPGNVAIGTTAAPGKLTIVAAEQSGVREQMITLSVASDTNTKAGIINATSADNLFVPSFYGYRGGNTNKFVTAIRGYTDATGDVQQTENALVDIGGFVTDNASDPNNGNIVNPSNRNILSISNWDGPQAVFNAKGSLGIGTYAPRAALDVVGTTNTTSAIIVPRADTANRPSTPVNGMIRYNTTSNKLEAYANSSWSDFAMGAGGGGSSQWTTSGSNIYSNNSGNVGIGSNSPNAKLEVVGTILGTDLSASSRIGAFGGNVSFPTFSFGGASQNGMFPPAPDSVGFATVGTERLRIDSTGRVGIGTATVGAALDVYATGAASAILIPRDTTARRPTGVNGMMRFNTDSQALEIYGSGAWLSLGAANISGAGGGGSSQWTTTGSDIYFSGGKVGIGTSFPAANLHVAGATTIFGTGEGGSPGTATLRGANGGGANAIGGSLVIQAGQGTGTGGSGAISFMTGQSAAVPSVAFANSTTSNITTWVNSTTVSVIVPTNLNRLLIVETNTTTGTVTSMTYGSQSLTSLWSSGVTPWGVNHSVWYLVGPAVGTATLTINFSQTVQGSIAVSNYYNVDQTNTFGAPSTFIASTNATSDTRTVSSSANALVIDSFGEQQNCGTPGAGQTNTYSCVSTTWGRLIGSYKAGAPSVNMVMTYPTNNRATHFAVSVNQLGSAGGTVLGTSMYISPTGLLGVGTTSPAAALDVAGAGATSAIVFPRDTTANRPSGVAGMVRFNTDAQALEVFGGGVWTALGGSGSGQWTTSGSNLYFGGTGNVGIGTATPGTALDVNGGIRAGSSTVVTATCDATTEGIQRYNKTNHYMEFCDGTNWVQIPKMGVGSTLPVTTSGPAAAIFAPTGTTCNYTPAYGSCGNLTNGTWPANGTNVTAASSCLSIIGSGSGQQVVLDLGSVKSIGNFYISIMENSNDVKPAISFSTDNITYGASTTFSPASGVATTKYYAYALGTTQTARYVRVTNGAAGTASGYSIFCQFAVGP